MTDHTTSPGSSESPSAEPEPTDLQPTREKSGSQIGPYKLLQQIGEGGMGVVYMAEQTAPVERRVALKIIKPGMDSRQVIGRFEAERQALAMMDHPNIAKVLDAGTTAQHRPYFVMEMVRGVPITKYCDENRLTLSERLQLFVSVCQAIQHAHLKGIVHRDIKPSNVLVCAYDGCPAPKVIDFGVAKAVQQRLTDKTVFTEFGQVVGTLEYMSPEQAEMNQLDIDTRSDIYSLGVLLYELLTGSTPISKKELRSAGFEEMLRLIRDKEAERPSTRLSGSGNALPIISSQRRSDPKKLSSLVRGDLDWIVMKALEKDRNRRYATANGLARDIERHLADEPVEARPPSAIYKLQKFVRKHRIGIAIAASFAALLCLASVVSTLQLIRATRAERTANQARQEAVQQADEANDAKTEAERASDAASRALFDMQTAFGLAACDRGDAAEGALWFANAASIPQDPNLRSDSRVRALAFQRDAPLLVDAFWLEGERLKDLAFDAVSGRFLATLTYEGQCLIRDLHVLESYRPPGVVESIALSPNKQEIAIGYRDGDVSILSLGNWRPLQSIRFEGPVKALAYGPRGQNIAIGGDFARVYDLETQTFVTPPLPHPQQLRSFAFSSSGDSLATDCEDNRARLFDLSSERPPSTPKIAPLPHQARWWKTLPPCKPLFLDQDRSILTLQTGMRIVRWNTESGEPQGQWAVKGNGTNMWELTPDGRVLVVGGAGPLNFLDLPNGQQIREHDTLGGHTDSMALSPDGTMLLTGSSHGELHSWHAADGSPAGTLCRSATPIIGLEFSPDGRHFAMASVGLVQVFTVPGVGACTDRLPLPGKKSGMLLSDDERYLLPTGSIWWFGTLHSTQVWDLKAMKPIGAKIVTPGLMADAAFTVGAEQIVTASVPNRVHAWDWRSGEQVWEHAELPGMPCGVACHPTEELAGVLCDGGGIVVLSNGKPVWNAKHAEGLNPKIRRSSRTHSYVIDGVRKFTGLNFPDRYLRCSSDGKWLISSGLDSTVRVWNFASGKPRYDGLVHSARVIQVALSHNQKLLCTATEDGLVHIWDFATGQPKCDPLPHPMRVNDVSFSRDDRLLLTGSKDGTLRVWNWAERKLEGTPLNHGDAVMATILLNNDRWIASTGGDRMVRIWSRTSGHALTPAIPIDGAGFSIMATSDNKTLLASGGTDSIAVVPLEALLNFEQADKALLEPWAEIVSGQRVQNRQIVRLTSEELRTEYRVRGDEARDLFASNTFLSSPIAWHHQMLQDTCKAAAWYAAQWHARRLLQEVESDSPSPSDEVTLNLIQELAIGLKDDQRDDEAETWYREVISKREARRATVGDADNLASLGGTYSNLANVLARKEQYMQSLEAYRSAFLAFEECLRIHPYHISAQQFFDVTLGNLLSAGAEQWRANRGDAIRNVFAESIEISQRIVDSPAGTASAANTLAWHLANCPDERLREPEQALALAKLATTDPVAVKGSFNTLGVAYYRCGEWLRSIEVLQQSVESRDGGDAFDWIFLAMAHWQLAQREELSADERDAHLTAARKWRERAKASMEKEATNNDELRGLLAEAKRLFGDE